MLVLNRNYHKSIALLCQICTDKTTIDMIEKIRIESIKKLSLR